MPTPPKPAPTPTPASTATAGPRNTSDRSPLRWLLRHPLVVGLAALLWLLVRTGLKPSRFTYPCQQAALRSAWLAVVVALGPWALESARWGRRRKGQLAASSGLVAMLALGGISDHVGGVPVGRMAARAPANYNASVYVAANAGGSAGDHQLCMDDLIGGMGSAGLKLFKSASVSADAGPDGMVGADDVVLIKVNQQWPERGGTNTDVLKGLIARLLEHPDGFHGEVVVVENGQGLGRFDWDANNAEDHAQSVQSVVDHFAGLGQPVSDRLWDDIRDNGVGEYSAGDMTDGYIVGPWEDDVQGCVSYPKFRTPAGSYVSLKYGVWNPATSTYDNTRLKFFNLPVLKCHAAYGVTASVKHHMGTVTNSLGTNAHAAVANGAMGAFLAEVRMPDLNIIDCTYILALPDQGPAFSYGMASRTNTLVASTDPVALDMWTVTNVLVPAIVANGFTSYPNQDPADSSSSFRQYLDRTAARLNAAGIAVTADLAHINAHACTVADTAPGKPVVAPGAHPNPFTSSTTVRFVAARAGTARFDVFDVGGRLRRSLRANVPAGAAHEFRWDGLDDAGHALPAGTYYYRLGGAAGTATGKVSILR